MLTLQEALSRLSAFWAAQGCLTVQPMNTEVGAGTLNPATFLRSLGPEPWRVAYVEPSVRPDDSRYGQNPNRLQTHTQFQVILKPEPGNAQELYLDSLAALGIDTAAHDVRFVEDNWAFPAFGAWGLGWEVWLDGLEITQFTYFQQVGGVTVDPPSVEITYGVERILMALQGVQHFKDIAYSDSVTYGEVFGQSEYEMSRYYLDDGDVAATRTMLELYAAEAQRMVDAELPIPAYGFIAKCSHAFNVLDSRGAVSTSERATEFARMRRLAGSVAQLWMAKRAELGHPLGLVPQAPAATAAVSEAPTGDDPRRLVFEIGTEEMPPAEARAAREQLRKLISEGLAGTRLTHGDVRVLATPRRLVAFVDDVAAREPDHTRTVKGPKASAAYKDGQPTPALAGFARSQGIDVSDLQRAEVGGVEHVVVLKAEPGRPAAEALAEVLAKIVPTMRSAKNMRWLDPQLSFTRPIRWLLALWGEQIIPVQVSTLAAGRTTRVHRDAAHPVIEIAAAEDYLAAVEAAGIHADPDARRAKITAAAEALADEVDGTVDLVGEAGLIEQITYLVEEPNALLGHFDPAYLELPDAILTTVMRKHQRYLPIRDAAGKLLPHFVAVANGHIDPAVVRAGNEAVLRARYEDAAFFFRADLKLSPATMRAKITGLTFTDKLGSVHDRSERIAALAGRIADGLASDGGWRRTLDRARELLMFDLGSQMVTEMTSLAGVMAREYAVAAGETPDVAEALYEAELPRQTGDVLPRSLPGAVLALAGRLDLLTGLAATVGLPTGSSDPFAIRRAALGILAITRTHPAFATLSLTGALAAAAGLQPVPVAPEVLVGVDEFLARRLEQLLTEEGHPVDRVRATLIHAARPALVDRTLGQLDVLLAAPEGRRLVEAIERIRRIVPAGTAAEYDPALLVEPAELALHEALAKAVADLDGSPVDLARFAQLTTPLVEPIEAFFTDILVMAPDPQVRATRLGLLARVRDLGAGVVSWQQLV